MKNDQDIIDTKSSFRLRAARVVAGFSTLIDPADRLGLTKAKYQKLEAGTVRLNPVDAERIAMLFGVSRAFLMEGSLGTDRDKLANRIAELLFFGGDGAATEQMRRRLIQLRQSRGHASARAAAANFGWKPQTYGAHERGTATLSIERLIGYGLAFRAMPEYMVTAYPPMDMPKVTGIESWIDVRGSIERAKPSKSVNWRWLAKQTKSNAATVSIVELSGGILVKSSMPPMTLPAQLLPDKRLTPYGILSDRAGGKTMIFVVDPSNDSGEAVMLTGGTILVVDHLRDEDRIVADPFSVIGPPPKNFYLGSLLTKVCIG